MVIDKTSTGSNGHIYSYWTTYYSRCQPGFFTRSTDGGLSYEDCSEIPGSPYWGTLCVAKNGDLYVGGISFTDFLVVKSTNAKNPESTVSWHQPVTVDLGGVLDGHAGPNPGGLLGQTLIAVDTTDGPFYNYVYLLASVNPDNSFDHRNVMFARSTDGGVSWSEPRKVNDDEDSKDSWQWFGTMSVAPDGRIDVVWLDTRDDSTNSYMSALYYSYSYDAGETWATNMKLSESFNPHIGWPDQQKMGDYFDMVSDTEGVHLAWANTFNGEQDVYYARITTPVVGIDNNEIAANLPDEFKLNQNYPNPFNPTTTISYQLPSSQHVTLRVSNSIGEVVETPVNEYQSGGYHSVKFNAGNLASGIYFYTITSNGRVESRKMVLVK